MVSRSIVPRSVETAPGGLPVASSARCSAPNEPAFAQNGRALERVAELADVARPVVPEQRLAGVPREARRRSRERLADVLQQRLAERENVGGALPERWDPDVEHLQPVVQVLAEVAAFHGLPQVAVGRRDHANVRLQDAGGPEPLELAFLQDAQELRLRRQAHLGDFVEKQHAAGRPFRSDRVWPAARW